MFIIFILLISLLENSKFVATFSTKYFPSSIFNNIQSPNRLMARYLVNKGVLWDVDGTLSDSFMLGFESTQQILQNNGYNRISEDDYHKGTRYTTPRRLAWHVTDNLDDPIGINLGNQFDELYVKLVSPKTAPLYDGIKELLQDICSQNHVKVGALSNACGSYVESVLIENKIKSFFIASYGADQVPEAKPSSLGLLKLSSELDLNPSDCVYIGDSPSDGEAAKAAGMYSIGVTWGSHPISSIESKFDRICHTVSDLHIALKEFIIQ